MARINGEAIYGSKPWMQAAEGWLRFTVQGDKFYVTGARVARRRTANRGGCPRSQRRPRCPAGAREESLTFRFEDGAMIITMPARGPEAQPSCFAWVFRISP